MTIIMKPNKAPLGERSLITAGRLRRIRLLAPKAGDLRARELYEELYGATPGPQLALERIRASLVEAVEELLDGTEKDTSEPEEDGAPPPFAGEDDVTNLL